MERSGASNLAISVDERQALNLPETHDEAHGVTTGPGHKNTIAIPVANKPTTRSQYAGARYVLCASEVMSQPADPVVGIVGRVTR